MSLDSLLQTATDDLPSGAGPLALLSSDEFLPPADAFDRRLLELTGTRIGVIYCADHRAQPHSERYARRHFEALGARAITLDMHGDSLRQYDLAYIAGGSPKDLLEHLRDSARWPDVIASWRAGGGLAGSSAGAMVLCKKLLTPAPGARVPTMWTEGVGVIDAFAVAVHASSRSKEWLQGVAANAPVPVVALADRTGVILRREGALEIFGDAWIT
jgi:cobyrinic acid a,c-diamide synthase